MNTPRLIVIDTQSVLDWLVFEDPACVGWTACLQGDEWQWVFTSWMKSEFDYIAAKGFGPRWPVPPREPLDAPWQTLGRCMDPPAGRSPAGALRCTDPDDQAFLDLAVATGAAVLISRDKAVLRLARPARERFGLRICRPGDWP